MTLLIWLKIMADLSFYYAYAGFIASFTGSASILPGVVIPSLLCALSQRIRIPSGKSASVSGNAGEKRSTPSLQSAAKVFRCAALLPGLLCFLLPGMSTGDCVALIPALLYCGYLAWTDTYDLSHDRQTDVFLLFIKSYPVFFLMMLLFGTRNRLLTYSLPFALLTVVLCVFLLRILRHEPEVYLKPRFLLINGLTLAGILGIAWLLHLKAVTNFLTSLVMSIYNYVVIPIFSAILYVIARIVTFLVSPLFALFQPSETETISLETNLSPDALTDQSASGAVQAKGLLHLLEALFFLTLIALAAAVLIRLFRYLAGSRADTADSGLPTQERRLTPHQSAADTAAHLPASPLHPVNRVRRQYRRYLKLCREHGFTAPSFYTSFDVRINTAALYEDQTAADQLRALYIRARYQGSANREDAAAAERIVDELRRQMKSPAD